MPAHPPTFRAIVRASMVRVVAVALSALVLALGVMALFAAWAFGHEAPAGWSYDTSCCSGRDCEPIASEHVQVTPGGYLVTLAHGDHSMVAEGRIAQRLFRYRDGDPLNDGPTSANGRTKEVLQSGDSGFHACVGSHSNPPAVLCLYAPQEGS